MDSFTIDDLFSDLHVIGSIREFGRLCIENGHLSTESCSGETFFSWAQLALKRWLKHDNRTHTLIILQNIVLKINSLKAIPPEYTTRLHELVKNALDGLDNLKKTYKEDTSTVSRITILQDRLLMILKNNE